MKLLMISSLYGISGGGAGLMVWHLARGLSDSGNKVVVVTLGGTHHPVETEEHGLRVIRFQPINLYPFSEKDTRPAWQRIIWQSCDVYNPHSAYRLQQIVERESPDIIHVHKMRGFSGAVWGFAKRMHSGRVIQTCHDYESMSPDGLLRGFVGAMALRRQWPLRGYQLLRAWLSTGVSVVTAPSRHTLQRVTDSGLFPRARREVIPNTHGWTLQELETIHARMDHQASESTRFLFLGRLEREKGIVQFCEAFLQALDHMPDILLDVAGWGSLEDDLHQKYGRHPSIRFLGVVDAREKQDALFRSTVMVVPSVVEEVFGLTVVEAYAFGKPVIASNTGGLSALIRQGETGWLVEPGDVRALTKQIVSVASMDPTRRVEMSQACKAYSREFALDKISKRYLAIYSEMMK